VFFILKYIKIIFFNFYISISNKKYLKKLIFLKNKNKIEFCFQKH